MLLCNVSGQADGADGGRRDGPPVTGKCQPHTPRCVSVNRVGKQYGRLRQMVLPGVSDKDAWSHAGL